MGEQVCTCKAYPFPHRMFGGRCDGYFWVLEVWSETSGYCECEGCRLNYVEDFGKCCEVVDGREDPEECPQLQEYIRVNEIKILPSDRR